MQNQIAERAQSLEAGVGPHLPSRCHDSLPQDDETAVALERVAHDDLFGSIESFVKAANGVKGSTRAEQEAAGRQPRGPKQPCNYEQQQPSVQRDATIEADSRPATNRTEV